MRHGAEGLCGAELARIAFAAGWTSVGRYLYGDLIYDTSELAAGMKLLRERICIVLLCSYRYDLVLMRLGLTHDDGCV